ncbi:hypothetical protein MCNF_45320 [Mycolicibacterium confluentis]|uniref:Uncharacterized protein n=1 Tax=Mycolicibacterium confluentis TaxID=28047 RepID=A0A7I7Y2R9_9MYCO|nr:hypothetical protein MCNF_45320 [Mycolicibacterium confluentis]
MKPGVHSPYELDPGASVSAWLRPALCSVRLTVTAATNAARTQLRPRAVAESSSIATQHHPQTLRVYNSVTKQLDNNRSVAAVEAQRLQVNWGGGRYSFLGPGSPKCDALARQGR